MINKALFRIKNEYFLAVDVNSNIILQVTTPSCNIAHTLESQAQSAGLRIR